MTKLVMRLKNLSCNYCTMTTELMLTMMSTVARSQSQLRSLHIIRSDLTKVTTQVLEKVVKKLEHFNTNYCKLTPQQKSILQKK